MSRKKSLSAAIFCFFLWAAPDLSGSDSFNTKARVNADAPGIVEAILPPELNMAENGGFPDLVLYGPDGRPRSFELYWREPVGRTKAELSPVEISLKDDYTLVWEGKTDQTLQADGIDITIADEKFVARVDIDGWRDNGWATLKKDAALFRAGPRMRTLIGIEKNIYRRVRLIFRSFDKAYEKKFAPVRRVMLVGERPGKNYFEKTIRPEFQQAGLGGVTEIRMILPGSGLWIESICFATQAQFQGTLVAGFERIEQGEQKFSEIQGFSVNRVSRDKQQVLVDFHKFWPGRSLILKLDSRELFVGRVSDIVVTARCPRMVFLADAVGTYMAVSGTGKPVKIHEHPKDENRRIDHDAAFYGIESGPARRPKRLVEKYRIMGGPFNGRGYAWRSDFAVPDPGYYRLVLNMDASLEKNRESIRIVKGNTQIPFVIGRSENTELDLTKATDFAYDPDHNTSTLTISFPRASSNWSNLTLHASGIFKRTLQIEIPKPGNMGWLKSAARRWESTDLQETRAVLTLSAFPAATDRLRIVIPHGDNQPVNISRITAAYAAPSLNFIALEKGDYAICGGNPDALPPVYDLTLVRASLLEELPKTIRMGDVNASRANSVKQSLENIFIGKGVGLYAVLGLVTMFLLVLVIKLFPKKTT